jgi:mRNA interferase YafQ
LRKFTKRRPALRTAIKAALQVLAGDAFDATLKTHKLSGELDGSWACSAGYDVRNVFLSSSKETPKRFS